MDINKNESEIEEIKATIHDVPSEKISDEEGQLWTSNSRFQYDPRNLPTRYENVENQPGAIELMAF